MDFKDYIQGSRHGQEAHKLEREAMSDPFLQDAIDGYDSSTGNPLPAIEDLERKIAKRGKTHKRQAWIWSAAALLLLLIGSQWFLWIRPDNNLNLQVASTEQLAVLPMDEPSPESPADSAAQPEKLSAEMKVVPELQNNENAAATQQTKDSIFAVAEELENAPRQVAVADAAQSQPDSGIDIAELQISKVIVEEPKEIDPAKINPADNQKHISGRIVDEIGEPVIGASVNIKNTNNGAITDQNGNFTMVVPKEEQGTLVASFIGMKTTEIPLKESLGDIMLKSDDMALNEVVVIGYGTRKKENLSASASKTQKPESIFGESEFTDYFQKNCDKKICAGQALTIVAEFYIDAAGRPGNIRIKELSCPAMETEFKRLLLGSPLWSERNRNVKLRIDGGN
ncbi:MAG: carboxypeptidase-like regulatory domain-containing protein [Dysgonamonadaceae bacterium]|jgi:hypothetical protein|nr:carboxypeptidase-like regulatory domain-containing protein [Dysgonamonadaceae bacterium]